MPNKFDEQSVVWISVPLSAETADMLQELADMCHAEPRIIAASLLRDVLADDAAAHDNNLLHSMPTPSNAIN